jgi:hypothetical protein
MILLGCRGRLAAPLVWNSHWRLAAILGDGQIVSIGLQLLNTLNAEEYLQPIFEAISGDPVSRYQRTQPLDLSRSSVSTCGNLSDQGSVVVDLLIALFT